MIKKPKDLLIPASLRPIAERLPKSLRHKKPPLPEERYAELIQKQEERAAKKAQKKAKRLDDLREEAEMAAKRRAENAARTGEMAPVASPGKATAAAMEAPQSPPPLAAPKPIPRFLLAKEARKRDHRRQDARLAGDLASHDLYNTLKCELERMGFVITSHALTHQEYGIVVPLEGGDDINVLIQHLHKAKTIAEELWLDAEVKKEKKEENSSPHETKQFQSPAGLDNANGHANWNPFGADQTAFLLDASVLRLLLEEWRSATNQEFSPGAELLNQTARLPNVKIIVPAYIAYLEMQGRIPAGNKKGYIEIDTRPHPTDFFDNASRVIADNEGNIVDVKRGANPNIIIWEGKKDRELFAKIARHASERNWEEVKKIRKDAGERCIDDIAEVMPMPVHIIAEDYRYYKERSLYTTRHGYPISEDNLPAYLAAELNSSGSRKDMLATCVKEPDLTVKSILDRINEWRKKHDKKEHNFLVRSKLGEYDPARHGSRRTKTMREVIKKGWNMLMRAQHKNSAPAIRPSAPDAAVASLATGQLPQTSERTAQSFDPPAWKDIIHKIGHCSFESDAIERKTSSIEICNIKAKPLAGYLDALLRCRENALLKQVTSFVNGLDQYKELGSCRRR